MLRVTYVWHSCFVVELDHHILVFDYFPKEAVETVHFEGKMPELDANKHIYVFASHSHKDHFSLEVLHWKEKYPKINYIFSKDIRLGRAYLMRHGIDPAIKKEIQFVSVIEKYEIDDLIVETLRSTDAGVAYLVSVEGQTIYHAGDLHWWNSGMEAELYTKTYGDAYKRELHRIKNRHIDVAFVVLDPRLGDAYYLGMEYFLKNIDVDVVFPMHLWKRYDLIERFKRRPELVGLAQKVVSIDRENIIFDLD